MSESQQIEFTVPGPDAPGFLRRMRRAVRFAAAFGGDGVPAPEDIDELVEFLAEFVTVPADPAEARSALWNASQEQLMALLRAVSGGGQPAVNPPNAAS